MANEFLEATSDIAEMAASLIDEHHDHLAGIRIEFVLRTEPVKRGDRIEFGKASKKSGLDAFLAKQADGEFELTAVEGPKSFFVIQIWQRGWTTANESQRRRILDHLLCYLSAEETTDKAGRVHKSISLNVADVVEFRDIYSRYPASEADNLALVATRAYVDQQKEKKPEKEGTVLSVTQGGKAKAKGAPRKKKDIPVRTDVVKEEVKIGTDRWLMAATPDGDKVQLMISRQMATDKEPKICVAGKHAETVDAARAYFKEYLAEFQSASG